MSELKYTLAFLSRHLPNTCIDYSGALFFVQQYAQVSIEREYPCIVVNSSDLFSEKYKLLCQIYNISGRLGQVIPIYTVYYIYINTGGS